VIVWPRSGDSDAGHVAYVQSVGVDSVSGNDLVTLQEMNDTTFDDPAQGQGDTMVMSMDSADLSQVQIIHAPGNTSGTVPAAPAVSDSATTPAQSPTTLTRTSTSPARTITPSRTVTRHRRPRHPRHPRLRRREKRHGNHPRISRRRVMLSAWG
jgi:surface antigen